MMALTEASYLPFTAKQIAVMPAHSPSSVMTLGNMRLNERPAIGRTRTRRFSRTRADVRGGIIA